MNVYVVYVDKIFWNFGVIEFFVYLMIIAGKTIFLIRLVRVLDVLNNRADIGLNEFDKINWFPTNDCVEQCMSLMTSKYFNNLSLAHTNDVFKLSGQNSTITRASLLKLNKSWCKTNLGQNNLSYIAPNICKRLPASLKITESFCTYKRRVKKHFSLKWIVSKTEFIVTSDFTVFSQLVIINIICHYYCYPYFYFIIFFTINAIINISILILVAKFTFWIFYMLLFFASIYPTIFSRYHNGNRATMLFLLSLPSHLFYD